MQAWVEHVRDRNEEVDRYGSATIKDLVGNLSAIDRPDIAGLKVDHVAGLGRLNIVAEGGVVEFPPESVRRRGVSHRRVNGSAKAPADFSYVVACVPNPGLGIEVDEYPGEVLGIIILVTVEMQIFIESRVQAEVDALAREAIALEQSMVEGHELLENG